MQRFLLRNSLQFGVPSADFQHTNNSSVNVALPLEA